MKIARYILNFRLLAFLAMSCSIAAVARASGDFLLFWVSTAGLALGNIYTWRTHYARSRLRTGGLLLLLLILLFYLGRDMLFTRTGDQILLARYLVFGLIVTSFDLRTRRNVLGTLVLAGMFFILLSPMAFGIWFLLLMGGFMLLALAAATVGYGEGEASQAVVVGEGGQVATGRVGVGFALGFLFLAGTVFLLMPRFGLGSLAQASWLPSRIDLTTGRPGLFPSRPSAGVSPEILVSQQPGGAGRYVPLGYGGPGADAVVMYVRSPVPSYWRGSTLDEYDGVGWLPSGNRLLLVDEGRGEFVFPDSDLGGPGRRWYSQTYFLEVDQPNAVFTGYSPGRLYLPQENQGLLHRGTVYRALSPLPRLSPGLLRRDRVEDTDLANLTLPTISDRTAALADSIVAGAPTDYDKAARLEQFLFRNYRYDLGVPSLTPGRDAVDVFLFEQQAGYCAHFATAMAVMARSAGLPARVAVGYLPGVYDSMTGAYAVRSGDAHAWVEIHFRRYGWVAFDPTPRPDVALGPGGGWVSFGLGDILGVNLTGAVSSLKGEWLSAFRGTGQALLGAIIVAVALASLLVWLRRPRAERTGRGYTALSGEPRQVVLNTYFKMVAILARKGLPQRHLSQTPRQYSRLVAPWINRGQGIVEWLTEAATVAAYNPQPLSPTMAKEAREKFVVLKRVLTISKSQPQQE